MSQIFLSYSSNDRERVIPLVHALQEDGYTVWWDREIRPGPSFDREIEREISEAGCIVVVWSANSVESEWVRAEGPNGKIVLSSRVRFARNLRELPFPGWAKKPERQRVLEIVRPVVEDLAEMKDCFSDSMDNIPAIDKQVLVERHLISREHAAKNVGSAVVVDRRLN